MASRSIPSWCGRERSSPSATRWRRAPAKRNARSCGRFVPLVPGETTVQVPDGQPFYPVVVREGTIVAVGDPMEARAVVSGANWESDEAFVIVEPGRVATAAPLNTYLAARLMLHVPRPRTPHGATAVALLRCADSLHPPAGCRVVSEQWSETGVAVFESVVRGDYVARVDDDCFVRVFAVPGSCDDIDASCASH
jgi:hypothetical protein